MACQVENTVGRPDYIRARIIYSLNSVEYGLAPKNAKFRPLQTSACRCNLCVKTNSVTQTCDQHTTTWTGAKQYVRKVAETLA